MANVTDTIGHSFKGFHPCKIQFVSNYGEVGNILAKVNIALSIVNLLILTETFEF